MKQMNTLNISDFINKCTNYIYTSIRKNLEFKIRLGIVYNVAIKSTETSWIGVVCNVQIL